MCMGHRIFPFAAVSSNMTHMLGGEPRRDSDTRRNQEEPGRRGLCVSSGA